MQTFTSPDPRDGEPEPFTLSYVRALERTVEEDGQDPRVEKYRERREEVFLTRPDLPGTLLISVEMLGEGGEYGTGKSAVLEFLHAAIVDEQQADWRKLLEDPDAYVHVSTLNGIAGWLYNRYAAGPTPQS
jgi:hypothetical protein